MTFQDIVQTEGIVLVDFYAEWCGPCKMMAPILKEVKNELGEQVKIVKIDVDKNPQLAAKQQVRGVPTLVLYKNGEPKWRQSGVVPNSGLLQVISQFS